MRTRVDRERPRVASATESPRAPGAGPAEGVLAGGAGAVPLRAQDALPAQRALLRGALLLPAPPRRALGANAPLDRLQGRAHPHPGDGQQERRGGGDRPAPARWPRAALRAALTPRDRARRAALRETRCPR